MNNTSNLIKKFLPKYLSSLASIEEPGRLADTIAAHLSLKVEDKQELLETIDVGTRLERLMAAIEGEIDFLHVEKRVRDVLNVKWKKVNENIISMNK